MARLVYERADVVPMLAEVFREFGYDGASMARIHERTGLGKGSLYHFFPGGKEDMAAAVLADIDAWFERQVFEPLRVDPPQRAIEAMWRSVADYFHGGGRVCLVGAFALDGTRDRFATAVTGYFQRWIDALADALVRAGHDAPLARDAAEEVVAGIQGAIVLSRALDDREAFARAMTRLEHRLRG